MDPFSLVFVAVTLISGVLTCYYVFLKPKLKPAINSIKDHILIEAEREVECFLKGEVYVPPPKSYLMADYYNRTRGVLGVKPIEPSDFNGYIPEGAMLEVLGLGPVGPTGSQGTSGPVGATGMGQPIGTIGSYYSSDAWLRLEGRIK